MNKIMAFPFSYALQDDLKHLFLPPTRLQPWKSSRLDSVVRNVAWKMDSQKSEVKENEI